MRRIVSIVCLAALAACGGGADSPTTPARIFPSMAGVWSITGAFTNGIPFHGTVTFAQASLQQPALGGSMNTTAETPLGPVNTAATITGSVSENGILLFNPIPPVGSLSSSRYSGVVTGTSVTGVLSDGSQ